MPSVIILLIRYILILRTVEVGIYQPLSQHLPLWLPTVVSLFFSYLSTLSLSLFFFNLLCLPHLDGFQLLSAIIDLTSGFPNSSGSRSDGLFGGNAERFTFNLEGGDAGRQTASDRGFHWRAPFEAGRSNSMGFASAIGRHKRDVERVAMMTTGSLAVFVVAGGLVLNSTQAH